MKYNNYKVNRAAFPKSIVCNCSAINLD